MSSDDMVNLKVPRVDAERLDLIAKDKSPVKTWAQEAREILHAAAVQEG